MARCIGARPGSVTFTAGATEANNLAFAATEGHVVTDAIEHESVLACAEARPHAIVGVGPDGPRRPRGRALRGDARHAAGLRLARKRGDRLRPARARACPHDGPAARGSPCHGRPHPALSARRRLAGGKLPPRGRGLARLRPADALRRKDRRPKAGGALVGLRRRGPAPARAGRRPGGRPSLRHGERGRHHRASRGRWSLPAAAAARSRVACRRSGVVCSADFCPSSPGRWSPAPRRRSSGCPGFST